MEMIKVESVEDLEVFKRSHRLTIKVYKNTEQFPKSELFGIISQMRRAAASIAANLMEGSHRLNRAEYRQFGGIARGSVGELKYHFLLAKDLGYLSDKDYTFLSAEADEISRMLSGLAKSLARK